MFTLFATTVLTLFQESSSPPILEVGASVQADLTVRKSKEWRFQAKAGDRVEGFALQGGIDLGLTIVNPQGETLLPFDVRTRGIELFRFRAAQSGEYLIRVHNLDAKEGHFELHLGLCETESSDRIELAHQYLRRFPPNHPGGGFVAADRHGLRFIGTVGCQWPNTDQAFSVNTPIPSRALELELARLGLLYLHIEHDLNLESSLSEAASLPQLNSDLQLIHILRGESGLRDLDRLQQLKMASFDSSRPRLTPTVYSELLESQVDLNFEPGREHHELPSDLEAHVLQRVCEQISGMAYQEFLRELLLPTLGLTNTTYKSIEQLEGNRCFKWQWDPDSGTWIQHAWLALAPSDATIETSLEDLGRLLAFTLSEHPLALARAEHFVPLARTWDNRSSSTIDFWAADDSSEDPVYVFGYDTSRNGLQLSRWELQEILRTGEWRLTRQQRTGQYGGRGGRGTSRKPTPPPVEPTPPAAGKYYSGELELCLEIVLREDGAQYLIHPAGLELVLAPTADLHRLKIQPGLASDLVLGRRIDGMVSEIFLNSSAGVRHLRFVRVDDSSAAGD